MANTWLPLAKKDARKRRMATSGERAPKREKAPGYGFGEVGGSAIGFAGAVTPGIMLPS